MRYYWFLGYYYFKHGDFNQSKKYLNIVLQKKSFRFPVETLNSFMIMIVISQIEKKYVYTFQTLLDSMIFYKKVKNDFEVSINFKIYDWLISTKKTLLEHPNASIECYEFAY